MPGVPISPRRVYGVALGMRAGGDGIWVCRATPGAQGLRLEAVDSLAAMPGGAVEHRDPYQALVSKILEVPRSAWGFDTPFSLPAVTLQPPPAPAASSDYWTDLLQRALGTAPEAAGVSLQGAPVAAVPAAQLQAWIRLARGVLGPARAQGPVAVLPLDPLPLLPEGTPKLMRARAPSIYLLQVDPGRLLRDLGTDTGDTSGTENSSADSRRSWLRELMAAGQLRPVARALRTSIADLEHGSAFTAVVAAVAAWRGYRNYDHDRLHVDPGHGNEGFAYC